MSVNPTSTFSRFAVKVNDFCEKLENRWEKWAEKHPIASKVAAVAGIIVSLGLFVVGFIFDPILPISVPALLGGTFLFTVSVTTLAIPFFKKIKQP